MTPEHTEDLLRMYAAEAGAPWQRGYYWEGGSVSNEDVCYVLPPAVVVDTMHGALMAYLSEHNIMVAGDGEAWVAWRILIGDAGCSKYSRVQLRTLSH